MQRATRNAAKGRHFPDFGSFGELLGVIFRFVRRQKTDLLFYHVFFEFLPESGSILDDFSMIFDARSFFARMTDAKVRHRSNIEKLKLFSTFFRSSRSRFLHFFDKNVTFQGLSFRVRFFIDLCMIFAQFWSLLTSILAQLSDKNRYDFAITFLIDFCIEKNSRFGAQGV